ncbi:MAG: pyridoxal phosphate-dependent aminotransferase [Pyrinomonadaceae bacterium]
MNHHTIRKSAKLSDVFYDIRGPVMEMAQRLESEGREIIKLNIGNLAAFGLEPPDEILAEMIRSLPSAAGYTDSKGLIGPREAVAKYAGEKGIKSVEIDDIYLGNGASELIVMSLNALLDSGDEILVPAPDYPLWTGAVTLSGGRPIHYICDESNDWLPDLEDIKNKITSRTRGIVIINPNNPTGALYPESHLKRLVEIARQFGLIVFADEIYDKTLFDDNTHTSIASLADDVLFITFNGLSKNYRSCGYRAGWMIVSGDKSRAGDYVEGLNMLASMRLCSNTPGQLAIATALDGRRHGIEDLVAPGGRLYEQRNTAYEMLSSIPGVSVVKPKAALYMFPRLDPEIYPIADDQQFACDLLEQESVLIVQGTGFNWFAPDHFRMVFLPPRGDLDTAITRIAAFLERFRLAEARTPVRA